MKKLEQGRSMVEMLGVLAIIGVLSIGGIAGYTMAMNRNRANNVLDLANKLSAVGYAKCQAPAILQGANPTSCTMSLTDAGLTPISGLVTGMSSNDTGVVTITWDGAASNSVKDIVKGLTGEADATTVNPGHN